MSPTKNPNFNDNINTVNNINNVSNFEVINVIDDLNSKHGITNDKKNIKYQITDILDMEDQIWSFGYEEKKKPLEKEFYLSNSKTNFVKE